MARYGLQPYGTSPYGTGAIHSVAVSVTLCHNVEFAVTDDATPANNLANVQIEITQLGSRDQGIMCVYTRGGAAKYKRLLSPAAGWSREIDVALAGLDRLDLFRAGSGQVGIVGEIGGVAHLAWTGVVPAAGATEEWSGVETDLAGPLIPATIGSMVENDGVLRLIYTRAESQILATTLEHQDYQGVWADEVRTLHFGTEIQNLKARVLYESALWLVWNDVNGFRVGRVRPPIVDVETLSAGSITMQLDDPIANIQMELENVPPKLPRPRKPTWDGRTLLWHEVVSGEPMIIPQAVIFEAGDPNSIPLAGVMVAIKKIY